MGQSTVERPAGARWAEWWLGKGSPRWEGLISQLQATAFPFAAAGFGKNQQLPWVRGEFSATVFPPVAANFEAERRFPWLVSQLLVTVFPSVVTELEVDQRSVESAIQLQATTFPFAAASFGLHSDGLSEDRAEPGLLCHSTHLCGHGVSA